MSSPAANSSQHTVLLTGATGFVGKSLYPHLIHAGFDVRCATRHPEQARRQYPDRNWVRCDVEHPETLIPAMQGCTSAIYLIHQMGDGDGYRRRELNAATAFIEAAEDTGLRRIVYLGGVAPVGKPSEHLASRLETGRILRSGSVSTIELRAAMIIGAESASWRIVRDLVARLPVMVLPHWSQTRLQPIYINDVVTAICAALTLEQDGSAVFDIPGPQTMSVEEILAQTALISGHRLIRVRVPLLSPRFSSYWLKFITRCNIFLARELVQGLSSDLLAKNNLFWKKIQYTDCTPFDEAARIELRKTPPAPLLTRTYERLLSAFFRPRLLT